MNEKTKKKIMRKKNENAEETKKKTKCARKDGNGRFGAAKEAKTKKKIFSVRLKRQLIVRVELWTQWDSTRGQVTERERVRVRPEKDANTVD